MQITHNGNTYKWIGDKWGTIDVKTHQHLVIEWEIVDIEDDYDYFFSTFHTLEQLVKLGYMELVEETKPTYWYIETSEMKKSEHWEIFKEWKNKNWTVEWASFTGNAPTGYEWEKFLSPQQWYDTIYDWEKKPIEEYIWRWEWKKFYDKSIDEWVEEKIEEVKYPICPACGKSHYRSYAFCRGAGLLSKMYVDYKEWVKIVELVKELTGVHKCLECGTEWNGYSDGTTKITNRQTIQYKIKSLFHN